MGLYLLELDCLEANAAIGAIARTPIAWRRVSRHGAASKRRLNGLRDVRMREFVCRALTLRYFQTYTSPES